VFATLFTVPAERSETMSDTAITLAEEMAGKPEVFVKWFYPGRTTGHEFIYPQQQEKENRSGQTRNVRRQRAHF
jgi:hypothetical protein